MYVKIRKRTAILASVLAGLLIFGLCAAVLCRDFRENQSRISRQAENAAAWRQSISELAEALSRLETDLEKGRYASGDYQAVSWATQVFAEAGAARTALESLPVYELHLSGTETFLNQVGEFTLEMARKQMRGESLREDEVQSLQNLALRCGQLTDEILSLSEKISDENADYAALQALLRPSEEGEEKTPVESLEAIFAGDEPLIYDGDHSAWYASRTSPWISALPLTEEGQIRSAAAALLDTAEAELKEVGRYENPMEIVEYENGDLHAAYTLRGGKLYGFARPREVSSAKMSLADAMTKGAKALAELGYPGLEPLSWSQTENTVLVTYGARTDGVLHYADRVTATVALDNGEVLMMNGEEYLLSHNPDRICNPLISAEEGAEILREGLTVTHTDFVTLPGGDGQETLCWQYTVNDGSDRKVLIFVNAQNKVEEDIVLLTESDTFRKAQ